MRKKNIFNTRFVWADMLRALAIYLVIVVHSSGPIVLKSSMDIFNNFAYIISFTLAKTCVPVFIMLSGSLLLKKQENYRKFFGKRIKKVLFPWIIWTFIYMFWNYNIHHYHPQTISQWKYFFELTFLSELWFLPLIFSLYLITPLLRIIIPNLKKIDGIFLILLWFAWVSIIPFIHASPAFPTPQEGGLLASAIYYSGYFFLGYFLTLRKNIKSKMAMPLGIIFFGIILTFIELFSSKHIDSNLVFNYFTPSIVITSIGIFILIHNIYNHTYEFLNINSKLKQLIVSISNASLGIYIVHGLIMEICKPYLKNYILFSFNSFPLLTIYVYAFLIFTFSFLSVIILKNIPIVKHIVPD
jgi:surface polysaccharide O-acyltransferase-like enzyme